MAEKALKKVEDQLKCSICLDTYTNPRLLQCRHVYCHDCLTKLGQFSITCPTCRQVTPIRARGGGVAGLQPALQINCLLDIMEEYKREETFLASISTDQPQAVAAQYCSEHAGKELELYCETCLELICLKCAVKGGRHHSHDYDELEDAFEKCKKDITSSMKSIENELVAVDELLASLGVCCEDTSSQEEAVQVDINSTARKLHDLIDARKAELINQLHKLTQDKKDRIAAQRCQVEATRTDLCNYLDFVREILVTKSDIDILTMKMAIIMQVEELPKPSQGALKVKAETGTRFSTSSEVTKVCKNYGQILEESKCRTTVKRSASKKRVSSPFQGKCMNEEAREVADELLPCRYESDELGDEPVTGIAVLSMKSSHSRQEEKEAPVARLTSPSAAEALSFPMKPSEEVEGSFHYPSEMLSKDSEKNGIPVLGMKSSHWELWQEEKEVLVAIAGLQTSPSAAEAHSSPCAMLSNCMDSEETGIPVLGMKSSHSSPRELWQEEKEALVAHTSPSAAEALPFPMKTSDEIEAVESSFHYPSAILSKDSEETGIPVLGSHWELWPQEEKKVLVAGHTSPSAAEALSSNDIEAEDIEGVEDYPCVMLSNSEETGIPVLGMISSHSSPRELWQEEEEAPVAGHTSPSAAEALSSDDIIVESKRLKVPLLSAMPSKDSEEQSTDSVKRGQQSKYQHVKKVLAWTRHHHLH